MGLAEDFKNMGEEFIQSFDARVNFLGKNIVDTHRLQSNARKFLRDCHTGHKAMGKKLRFELGHFVDTLKDNVDNMRHKFQKEQRAVHQECKANHQAFKKVGTTMANKRRNFHTHLKNAKQKASRTH